MQTKRDLVRFCIAFRFDCNPYTQFLLTIISNEMVCWIFADVFVPNVNFNHYLIQCFGLLITASSMVVFVILFV